MFHILDEIADFLHIYKCFEEANLELIPREKGNNEQRLINWVRVVFGPNLIIF